MAENHHSARWRPLTIPVALLAIVILFFWKLTLSDQFTWMEGPDVARQVLPWFQFQVGEWQRLRFPLWDPFVWGGQPLLAQAQPGAAYPLNWLLFLAPTRHGWMKQITLDWYFVLIHYLAVLFAYKLARDIGLSRTGSVLAGLAYGCGGVVGFLDWPQMLNGAIWAPLVLMYVLRALRRERPLASAIRGGFFLGMAVLSGHHQIPIYVGLAAGGLWLWGIVRDGAIDWRMARAAGLFLIVAVFASGLQTLPAWEYSRHALRWVGLPDPVGHEVKVPYSVHQHYSLGASSLLGIVLPGIHKHANPHVGFVVLALALAGAAALWSRAEIRLLAAAGLGGLLFALGGESIFHGVLYGLLPVIDKARSPGMAVVIFQMAAAVLAGAGLDSLRAGRFAPVRPVIATAAILAAMVSAIFYWHYLTHGGKFEMDTRPMATALIALLAAAAMSAFRAGAIGGTALAVSLSGLMLWELGNVSTYHYPHRTYDAGNDDLPQLAQDQQVARALASGPLPVRVAIGDDLIRYNFGDWYGLETDGGYLASVTRGAFELQPWRPRTKALLGITHYYGKTPKAEWNLPVAGTQGPEGVLFAHARPYPRVWAVHRAAGGFSLDKSNVEMDVGKLDLHKEAFLRGPAPKLTECGGVDFVRLLRREPQRVSIWAELPCRGMVVLADTHYPGWQASVDGRPAELMEVYGALRGVVVEGGPHRIEMNYRPWTVYVGTVMSLLALVSAVLAGRRRREY